MEFEPMDSRASTQALLFYKLASSIYITCRVISDEKAYLSNVDHTECHAGALEPVIMALVDLIMYPSNQSLFMDGK